MPLDSNSKLADINMHSHTSDCKEEISGKYVEYIEARRELLKAKCERVNNCVNKLLEDENVLLLLKGENLSLNKTCSLIYDKDSGEVNQIDKCTSDDREDISDDLDQHLSLQFQDVKSSGWRKVKQCLDNIYKGQQRTTYVKDICRLANKQPQICESSGIHRNMTMFFNNQMQHLQCVCRSLQKSEGDGDGGKRLLPAMVGGLCGLIFFIVILVFIFVCYRRRNSKKRGKQAPNVIYLPAPDADKYPVYQELLDDKNYSGYGKFPTGNPPALPMRYSNQEDEPAYLEPVEAGRRYRPRLPIPGTMNPNYGAPPEYTERYTDEASKAISQEDSENGYFQPLLNPPENKNKQEPEKSSGYETIEAVLSAEQVPNSGSVRTAPIPAKRSFTDRQEAPGYFELEQGQADNNITSV